MASCSNFPANKSKIESTTPIPNWLELPKDITSNILQRLGTVEILTSARNVCPYWWDICKDPRMWRTIQMTDVGMLRQETSTLSRICRYAVDQSCGGLEDIFIKYFATDDLLKYIADSACNLRCLQILDCDRVTSKGFAEVVRKLPKLEILDISYSIYPLLKSLRFAQPMSKYKWRDDDIAFGISKTMSRLCHLYIEGYKFTNDGLLAILDGCPLLEYLDLNGCNVIDLSESLMKRCCEKIKCFRPPTEEYSDDDHDHFHILPEIPGVDWYDPYDRLDCSCRR